MTAKEIELLRGRIFRELKFMNKFRSRKGHGQGLSKQQEFNTTSTEESESVASDSKGLNSYTNAEIANKSQKRRSRVNLNKMVLNFSSKFCVRRTQTSINTTPPDKNSKVMKIKKSSIVFNLPPSRARTSQAL